MTATMDQSTCMMRHLMNSCYRAEEGFRFAAEAAEDGALKRLLELYAQQRTRFAQELREYVPLDIDDNESTLAGSFSAIEDPCPTDDDVRKCVKTDAHAISLYKKALAGRTLPTRAHFLVSAQLALMQRGHERVSVLLQESGARANAPSQVETVSA